MSEHIEIVRRAATWAARKKLELDADLIEEIVVLRETHDGLLVGQWPAGSVEHLLLDRWPGHGSHEPDPERMGTSLETFWRFLRSNGLMQFDSAPPKRLALEFRRAVPMMGQRYADPAAQGFNRQLFAFAAEELDLDMASAETQEQLQDQLQQAVDAWNDLPLEERLRRSPQGSGPTSFGAEQLSATELLSAHAGPEPDEEDDETIGMSDPADSVPYARSAPFVRRCVELATWVGEGKELTAREVLRPKVAFTAYRELGLVLSSRTVLELPADEQEQVRADPARRAALEDDLLGLRRSALDIPELERIWLAAEASGLVEIRGRRAVGLPEVLPEHPAELVPAALHMVAVALLQLREVWDLPPIAFVLLPLALPDAPPITEGEIADLWWGVPHNLFGRHRALASRERSDATIRFGISYALDLGAFEERAGQLVPTPWGHDVALVLVMLMDQGELGEG